MSENNRYLFLDSSRGLAAFIVLLAHTIKTFSPAHFDSAFNLFWDSEAAVLYFFILSGFVLSESIKNQQLSIKNYLRFAAKRFCRIYPAFIIVLVAGFFLYPFFNTPQTGWLNDYWQKNFTVPDAIKQSILIVRIPNDPLGRILPHDWTLSIEILISLLLPILVRIAKLRSWLVLAATYLAVKILPIDPFLFDFAIGVFISTEKEFLKVVWKKFNILGHTLIVISAVLFLKITDILPDHAKMIEAVLVHSKSVGLAILLIALISSSVMQKLLTNKILMFQGKISYSLYLTHFVLVGIVFKNFPGLSFFPAFLMVYFSSILISGFLYYSIEKPWIRIGKLWFSDIKGQ